MSRCDLEVVLDKTDATYRPGERVKGEVRVTVNDRCDCKKLTLTRQWRTHGRGNTAKGEKEEVQIFSGPWMPGATLRYLFDVEVPRGPVSYHGHHLNVDWYLKARADIPWAIDPKAETEFLLVPGEDGRDMDLGPEFDPEKPGGAEATAGAKKVMGIVGGIFFLGGLVLAALYVLGLFDLRPFGLPTPPFGLAIFGLFAAIAGGLIGFHGLRNVMAERTLGRVRVDCSPRDLRAGQTVRCSIQFMPRKSAQLERVTAKLEGQEMVVSGSGTNRTTHRHTIHEEEVLLSAGRPIMRGGMVAIDGSLTIPEDAPATFMADDNNLTWSVELHVDIPGSPDYKEQFSLIVRP